MHLPLLANARIGSKGVAAGAVDEAGLWQWLLAFAHQPGVVEVLFCSLLLAGGGLVWWRLAHLVSGSRSRQALQDYLFGVEQALHGDLRGAERRLTKVVAEDPENHYARLLLGKVLAELGEPAQAHKQHLYLQRGFCIDSAANELLLAQSLLGAGLAQQAAEAAERVLQRSPDDAAAVQFLYRARLQSGEFGPAAAAGRRLLDLLGDGAGAQALRGDVAHAFAQAGLAHADRREHKAAAAALQSARRLDAAAPSVALLAARLAAAEGSLHTTVQTLLADEPPLPAHSALVPARAGPVERRTGLPLSTLRGLVPASRWRCRACGGSLQAAVGECPRCQCRGGAHLLEPALVAAVESPTHTMDAVDENAAHLRRIVHKALDQHDDGARGEVLHLGQAAVPELLAQAWQRDGEARQAAIDLLRAMGPAIAPALFAASDALEQQRLLPVGARSPAALVGRVVQGFDRSALPHFESLFASARAEHRKILIDFFLGLHDVAEFQIVLERFPPLEILHRINRADAAVLRRFLAAVPAGHFLAETLLLEPVFERDVDVFLAMAEARDPAVLERVLLQRGPSRALLRELLAALGDPALSTMAVKLLGGFGDAVIQHVVAAFTDPERTPAERARLGGLLTAAGPDAVERLCQCFGPEPLPLDDELAGVLAAMGDAAVLPLQTAYGRSGWVERITVGMIARHTNRRVQIVRTLQRLATPAAQAALRTLLEGERDLNLRLRLQQAQHGPGVAGGDHGPA